MEKLRVCIIGAGTTGLCAARHSKNAGMDVTVYEKSNTIGGQWVYTDIPDNDENGLNIHSSFYKGLKTNLPKEIMGFHDFPFPSQHKSYITADDVIVFLKSFTKQFDLENKIKFEHHVENIRPHNGSETQWEVTVRDLTKDQVEINIFDGILVCVGHYHVPDIPTYPGQELFSGKQLHSHVYRTSDKFKDKTVLIIGAGPSGIDLAFEIAKVANRISLSHHLKYNFTTPFPTNLTRKPDIRSMTKDGVEYVDGTVENFDIIFYCTGYKYSYPFLNQECGIICDDNYIRPLYKHLVNINRPTMAIVGIPFSVTASHMVDLQIRFFVKFLSGEKKFPSKEEMLADTNADMQSRWDRGLIKRHAHVLGEAQRKYYDQLAEMAEVETVKPVMTKLLYKSIERFLEDFNNFRNDRYQIVDDETFVKLD